MMVVLKASYCWGHRPDQQEERVETLGQKYGVDCLDQICEDDVGGVQRGHHAE